MSSLPGLLYFQIPIKVLRLECKYLAMNFGNEGYLERLRDILNHLLFINQLKFLQQSNSSYWAKTAPSGSLASSDPQGQWQRMDPWWPTLLPLAVSLCTPKKKRPGQAPRYFFSNLTLPQFFISSESALTQNHPNTHHSLFLSEQDCVRFSRTFLFLPTSKL